MIHIDTTLETFRLHTQEGLQLGGADYDLRYDIHYSWPGYMADKLAELGADDKVLLVAANARGGHSHRVVKRIARPLRTSRPRSNSIIRFHSPSIGVREIRINQIEAVIQFRLMGVAETIVLMQPGVIPIQLGTTTTTV